MGHRYVLILDLILLNDLFKVCVAELVDEDLRSLALIILRVVNVDEVDHIGPLLGTILYYEFARDIFTGFG